MSNFGQPEIWQSALHSTNAWIYTFVLAVIFPILDYVLYRRLKSTMQIYAWNILALWSLSAACVWTSRMNHLALSDLGEQARNVIRILVVTGIVAAIVIVLIGVSKTQKKRASATQRNAALDRVSRLVPESGTERTVWVLVSLTAGVCEEILYRGWLLGLFGAAFGSVWLGLLVSSVIFGFAHAYQGRNAILSTGVLGGVFGVLFIACGSLIPGQVLHVAMDMNNGLALGRAAQRAARDSA